MDTFVSIGYFALSKAVSSPAAATRCSIMFTNHHYWPASFIHNFRRLSSSLATQHS